MGLRVVPYLVHIDGTSVAPKQARLIFWPPCLIEVAEKFRELSIGNSP
jgi:hypothetical protein